MAHRSKFGSDPSSEGFQINVLSSSPKNSCLLLQCPHHTQNASLIRTDSPMHYTKESKQREGGMPRSRQSVQERTARRETWRMAGLALEVPGRRPDYSRKGAGTTISHMGKKKNRIGALSKK